MTIERNEAGWQYTRARRRQALDHVFEKLQKVLCDANAADNVAGIMFVALVREDGGVRQHNGVVVYGNGMLRALVDGCEKTLTSIAQTMHSAEQARQEQRVKGRREVRQ